MKPNYTNKHPIKVKLIFNPGSGAEGESPVQLMDIISEMQAWKMIPETFLVEKDSDLSGAIQKALTEGFKMFVVCGGDGTISAVARLLSGTDAVMGIIPTGTKNNIALSLGIPKDIPAAITILRIGQPIKIDVGVISLGKTKIPFLELCSVGLFSILFPSGNELQHGNITHLGDFLTTLVTSPPAEIHLTLDGEQEIIKSGHMLFVSNMPYFGSNYQISGLNSFKDGLLDVSLFSDLSKISLVGYFLRGANEKDENDPKIERFHAKQIDIKTSPSMSVMADGDVLGEGDIHIEVWQDALTVMVAPEAKEEKSDISEK